MLDTKTGLSFAKYSSFGNDFLILTDEDCLTAEKLASLASYYCDRHYGVGADGLLSWRSLVSGGWQLRIFNADGSEATMCGNGLRAWASWWFSSHSQPLVQRLEITTLAGLFPVEVNNSGAQDPAIDLDSGRSEMRVGWLQFPKYRRHFQWLNKYQVEDWYSGVPHALLWVDSLPDNWLALSEQLASSKHYFVDTQNAICNTNVDWLVLRDSGCIEIYTWEHGVGYSLACGTGSVAAAASYWAADSTAAIHGSAIDLNKQTEKILAVAVSYSGLPAATVTIQRDDQGLWICGSMAQPICCGVLL